MPSSKKSPATEREVAPTATLLATPFNAQGSRSKRKSNPQQSLALPEVERSPAGKPVIAHRCDLLWLCVYLPRLPLEALAYRDDKPACAVYVERHGMRRILEVNRQARQAGIGAGMSVNAALSLSSELQLEARDVEREKRLARRLAAWTERFTSWVVLESNDVLLLEIAGSERLFASLDELQRQVTRQLDAWCLTTSMAVAPTPLAATWLAKSGESGADSAHLVSRVSRLPLAVTAWPSKVLKTLDGMGVSSIGDCLRLPRPGFVRRFGTVYLQQLDRALGRLPDPRVAHRAPGVFCADYEFDEEQDDRELLLTACRKLLQQLEVFLRRRQVQTQRVQFRFFHLRESATQLTLGCMQAGQGIEHWFELLRIKFERMSLPAAVIALRLRGGRGETAALASEALNFSAAAAARQASIVPLLERLRARLGLASVQGMNAVAEHRPHCAWQWSDRVADNGASMNSMPHWLPQLSWQVQGEERQLRLRRPLWILERPERLAAADGMPMHSDAALTLHAGPERLESGWWDAESIARDYFIASTVTGRHLWVYRDRQNTLAWYVHGLFA